MPKVKSQTRTIIVQTQFLFGADLIRLLQDQIPKEATKIKITFPVPSGGDYSGMRLDINEEQPIEVQYVLEKLEIE